MYEVNCVKLGLVANEIVLMYEVILKTKHLHKKINFLNLQIKGCDLCIIKYRK